MGKSGYVDDIDPLFWTPEIDVELLGVPTNMLINGKRLEINLQTSGKKDQLMRAFICFCLFFSFNCSFENKGKHIKVEEFDSFFLRFTTDSIFAVGRISNSLYCDDCNYLPTKSEVFASIKNDSKSFNFRFSSINNQEKQESCNAIFQKEGTGVHIIYKFALLRKKWMLLGIEDASD